MVFRCESNQGLQMTRVFCANAMQWLSSCPCDAGKAAYCSAQFDLFACHAHAHTLLFPVMVNAQLTSDLDHGPWIKGPHTWLLYWSRNAVYQSLWCTESNCGVHCHLQITQLGPPKLPVLISDFALQAAALACLSYALYALTHAAAAGPAYLPTDQSWLKNISDFAGLFRILLFSRVKICHVATD